MILKPNDVLQEGDVIHFKNEIWGGIPVGYSIGMQVSETSFFQHRDQFDYVERPDPEPDFREHVRILREALGGVLLDLEMQATLILNAGDPQHGYHLRDLANQLRAALDATK